MLCTSQGPPIYSFHSIGKESSRTVPEAQPSVSGHFPLQPAPTTIAYGSCAFPNPQYSFHGVVQVQLLASNE